MFAFWLAGVAHTAIFYSWWLKYLLNLTCCCIKLNVNANYAALYCFMCRTLLFKVGVMRRAGRGRAVEFMIVCLSRVWVTVVRCRAVVVCCCASVQQVCCSCWWCLLFWRFIHIGFMLVYLVHNGCCTLHLYHVKYQFHCFRANMTLLW